MKTRSSSRSRSSHSSSRSSSNNNNHNNDSNNKRKAINKGSKKQPKQAAKKQKTGSRSSSTKRQRKSNKNLPPKKQQEEKQCTNVLDANFDRLDDLIIQIILSFLHVKSLLSLVSCSKHFRNMVSHELVVRAAIISGGHAEKTINQILRLIQSGDILVPSPLRLLRLTNGIKCELAENCIHPKATSKRVNFVRDTFGVFTCWECLTGMTGPTNRWIEKRHCALTVPHVQKKDPELMCTKLIAYRYVAGRALVLKEPFHDAVTGERVSAHISLAEYHEHVKPIVQKIKQKQMEANNIQITKDGKNKNKKKGNNHNNDTSDNNENNSNKPGKSLEEIQEEAEDLTEKLVEDHVQKVLKSGPWQSSLQLILTTSKQAKRDRANRVQEQAAKKQEHQRRLIEKRIAKIEKYTLMIEEAAKHGESKQIAKEYTKNYDINSSCGRCVTFTSPIFDTLMKSYIEAPSKGSKNKMIEVASQLDAIVGTLLEKGFLDFSFLKQFYDNETDKPMALALYEYLSSRFPTPTDVLLHKDMETHVYDKVKDDDNLLRLICMTFTLYPMYTAQDIDGHYGQGPLPIQVCGEAFAKYMAKYYNTLGDGIISNQARIWLGRSVWRHVFMKDGVISSYYIYSLPTDPNEAKDLCVSHFETAWKVYEQVLPLALEYIEDVKQNSYYPNETRLFGEQMSINDFLIGNQFWSWRYAPDLLLKRDFQQIRHRLARTWQMKAYGLFRALRVD